MLENAFVNAPSRFDGIPNLEVGGIRGRYHQPAQQVTVFVKDTSPLFNYLSNYRVVFTQFGELPSDSRQVLARAVEQNRVGELMTDWIQRSLAKQPEPIRLDYFSSFFFNVCSTYSKHVGKSWGEIVERLKSFAHLPSNWDTYGCERIGDETITSGLKLVDAITEVGGEPGWAEPTTDGTILLQHRLGADTLKWEIDDTDEFGVMIKYSNGITRYDDIRLDNLHRLLENLMNGLR